MSKHFNKLATQEGIGIDPTALSLIVREAEGSVRDGLSLLDQVFSFGEKHITVEDVTEVLGLVNRDVLLQLTTALLRGERAAALNGLAEIFAYGMDIKRFSADLLDCFRNLLLISLDGCSELVDLPEEELQRFIALAQSVSTETIHYKLNLLMRLVEEMRGSGQPRLSLETGFLKIIEAGNVVPVTDLLGRLHLLLDADRSTAASEPKAAAPPAGQKEATQDAYKKKTESPQPEPVIIDHPIAPEAELTEISHKKLELPPQTPATPESALTKAQPTRPLEAHPHEKDIRRDWPEFIGYVKERKTWMAQVLNRADSVKQHDKELHLRYVDPTECSLLRQKEHRNELTEFVLDFFQKELTLRFIVPEAEESGDETGAESPQKKRQQLLNDPLTVMTAEIFSGQVGDVRIGPRSR